MSLLLLFRGSKAPQFSDQATGNHTFLHFPTTTSLSLDLSTLLDVYIGDLSEIKYDVEEIRRRHLTIVMNQGEDVWLLPRIMKGIRCPYWKSVEENCEKPLNSVSPCYNTGWIGGYHNPLLMKIVFPPSDRFVTANEDGIKKEYLVRPWTVHTPRLQERMLLVRKYSGTRFEITNVTEQRWRGIVMHQEFDTRELTRGSSSYAYAVPVPTP